MLVNCRRLAVILYSRSCSTSSDSYIITRLSIAYIKGIRLVPSICLDLILVISASTLRAAVRGSGAIRTLYDKASVIVFTKAS